MRRSVAELGLGRRMNPAVARRRTGGRVAAAGPGKATGAAVAASTRAGPRARRRTGRRRGRRAGGRPGRAVGRDTGPHRAPVGQERIGRVADRRRRTGRTQALDRTHHDQAWRGTTRPAWPPWRPNGRPPAPARSRARPRYWWTWANRLRRSSCSSSRSSPCRRARPRPGSTRRWPWPRRPGANRRRAAVPSPRPSGGCAAHPPIYSTTWIGRPSSWSTCIAGRAGCW